MGFFNKSEIKSGSIPKKLLFFVRGEETVHFRWDDIDGEVGEGIKVSPTYIVDAENKKTHESAKSWAERGHPKKLTFTLVERENTPVENVRLVTLEHRGNGGRAYKVVVDDKFYFDLREDVLLDCILNAGIGKGGILLCEFLFMVVNAEMKLVRIGSLLHEKMEQADKFKETKAITSFDIGGEYKSKKTRAVYLGVWNTATVKTEGQRYSYGGRDTLRVAGLKDVGAYHVFYEVNDYSKWGSKDPAPYYLVFVKKPSAYKEKVDQHTVNPNHFIEKMMALAEKSYAETVADCQKHRAQNMAVEIAGSLEYYGRSLNCSKTEGFIHPLVKAQL